VDERDIEDVFNYYGEIRRIDIKNGFGFVEFYDDRDADDAINGEDGKELRGRRMHVEPSRGGGDRGRGGGAGYGGKRYKWRLRVEGLDSRTSWQDLKDFARKAGEVAFTDVQSNRGKKEGVIEYTNEDDMIYALKKLDDTKLDGTYVRLYEENKGGGRSESRSRSPRRKDKRSRSRSRSGSGSRSRSRDRDDKDDRDKDRDEKEKDQGKSRDDEKEDRSKEKDDQDDQDEERRRGDE